MNLEPAADPDRLYLATGFEVNPCRPLFTGDVFTWVEIPGVGTSAAFEEEFHVARLGRLGLAVTDDLISAERVACLTHAGINQLQQRLVFHQTRLNVPTAEFHMAFDHTYEEADLLEEWNTELKGTAEDTPAGFESWIRQGDPSRQSLLRTPQERAHVRRAMRKEISQIQKRGSLDD